jgi:Single-strand binding protein family
MSRTIKDISGISARRRRAILDRQQTRRITAHERAPLATGCLRRGRRRREARPSTRTEKEVVTRTERFSSVNSSCRWSSGRTGAPSGVDFVPVTLRDREAEMAARYLGDGSLIAIEGYIHSGLQPNPVVNDVRTERRSLYVIADRVVYLRLPRRTGERP